MSILSSAPSAAPTDDIRPPAKTRRGGGVNVRTLALVRWVAVVGQLSAVLVVTVLLGFPAPLLACLVVIAALAGTNLWLTTVRAWRARLSDYHAARVLGFDLVQVSALAYLTGGLANPFALMILVPVTVTAAALSRGAAVMVSAIALFCVTFLAFFHLPLPWVGEAPSLPAIYIAGHWTALAVAIVFMAAYVWSVAEQSRRREQALAETEAALAREQRMSALGGLAAAAAHELGSPLNTIGLVAQDLGSALDKNSTLDRILRDDVSMLIEQAERCRDILASLSERPDPGNTTPFGSAPLTAVAEEAAQGHIPDGVALRIEVDPDSVAAEPTVARSPELLHGVGNLVSNAGQFARDTVSLSLFWDEAMVRLTVADDGPGFPSWLLDSLGEPYLSTRAGRDGHMGLGVFIAQTLLDRTKARVAYRNKKQGGAAVDIVWARDQLDAPPI
ncbi:MAG: ActS/PrrB/RegB family redox-sensitive histidine kinase [Alphaproteobacteria bacterium]|nr:ActS/PrrB/RegB family redox-sensitive histidine kinase [Alphaproteobacteria bacterium]